MWTAGVKPHPVVAELGLPLDRHAAGSSTDTTCRSRATTTSGRSATRAAVPDPARKGQRLPADRAARDPPGPASSARNVAAALGGGRRSRSRTRRKGVFVDMGRRKAVADDRPIKWRGTPAWWLARTYHLAMMPGVGRRARLLVDWNVGLLFGRDTAELGALGHPPDGAAAAAAEARSGGRATASRAPVNRASVDGPPTLTAP